MLTSVMVVMLILWLFGWFGKSVVYVPVIHDHGWFHTFFVVFLILLVTKGCFGIG